MRGEIGGEPARPDAPQGEARQAGPRWARDGTALCLSGGGFRATLFHLGALRRLNELGVLPRLDTVTSVSGGSIINGLLATRWTRLRIGAAGAFANFDEEVAAPIRALCARDIRTPLLVWWRLNPANWGTMIRDFFGVPGNVLAETYEPLFRMKLSDLPMPGAGVPRFVFCATNVSTGACWHFHGGPGASMGDHYAGFCEAGWVSVAEAVAASSCFPLAFSALRLRLPDGCGLGRIDPWGTRREPSEKRGGQPHGDERNLLLTDGGVYDNLGVEPVWKEHGTLLVSDAGRLSGSVLKSSQVFLPRLMRAAEIGIEQVGTVRRRWMFEQLAGGQRQGALWTLHTDPGKFPAPGVQGYPAPVRDLLNKVRTDLNSFSGGEMACLENHGYALADAAVRSYAPHLCANPGASFSWPNPGWVDAGRAGEVLRESALLKLWRDIWGQITGATA